MNKIVLLFIIAATFTSCGEDIQFNNPAFQASKNGFLWKANSMQAFTDASGLTILASVGSETIELHTSSSNPGTYTLGTSAANVILYESANGAGGAYQAGAGKGSGKVVISSGQTAGTITGSFTFIGVDTQGNQVKFSDGVFYKVPQ